MFLALYLVKTLRIQSLRVISKNLMFYSILFLQLEVKALKTVKSNV
jgi:hypothetical protein